MTFGYFSSQKSNAPPAGDVKLRIQGWGFLHGGERRLGGEEIPCDEGVLEWVPMDEIGTLELWTGDRIFLSLLCEREEFFSLKLQYALDDTLEYAALDGKEMDYEEYLETHRI